MSFYGCNMNLELQQRAVEYNSVIRVHNNLSEGLFEQMPPIEMKTNSTYSNGIACEENDEPISEEERRQMQLLQQQEAAKTLIDIFKDDPTPNETPATTKTQNNNDLFDLMNDDVPSNVQTTTTTKATTSSIPNNIKSNTSNAQNDLDSLFSTPSANPVTKPVTATTVSTSKDIFDIFESNSSSAVSKDTKPPQFSSNNGLDDLLGLSGPSLVTQNYENSQMKPSSSSPNDLFDIFSAPAPTSHQPNLFGFQLNNGHKSDSTTKTSVIVGYDKNDLKITFDKAKTSSGDQHFIQMTASNSSVSTTIREFLFGVAVPKSMQMQLSQPTASAIEPLDSMNQMITIKNPNKVTRFFYLFVLLNNI